MCLSNIFIMSKINDMSHTKIKNIAILKIHSSLSSHQKKKTLKTLSTNIHTEPSL